PECPPLVPIAASNPRQPRAERSYLKNAIGSRVTDRFRNVNVLRGGDLIEQRLRIGGNSEHGMMLGGKKLLGAHVGKERKQEVIKPAGIEKTDRLEVQSKLEPGENLGDLLQGAYASGQCGKRVGELHHAMLAL